MIFHIKLKTLLPFGFKYFVESVEESQPQAKHLRLWSLFVETGRVDQYLVQLLTWLHLSEYHNIWNIG